MRRIGIYLGYEPHGGGSFQYSQSMLEAVAALPRDEFEVVALCPFEGWLPHAASHDVRAVPVRLGHWRFGANRVFGLHDALLRPWRRLSRHVHPAARALHAEQCDLWIFPAQDALAYQVGVPALTTIHDLMHRYERTFPEVSTGGRFLYRERHYAAACRHAQGILVDSEVGKAQVLESYPGTDADRLHVLPYIPPKYVYATGTPTGFDARYRLPPKFLFYPAQFWAHKNHERLLEAATQVARRFPDFQIVFAGSRKNAADRIDALVKERGLVERTSFLGYVPDADMPELYRRARGLIFPTLFGPTNIPPLEAFVTGCPVAASGIYGMRAQLGDAALFFNPTSQVEIETALERLWTDDALCAGLAANGRRRLAAWEQPQFNSRVRAIIEKTLARGIPS